MANKYVHIVCFDVPYPVSHGGFFDLFYKIKSLYERGIQIYLHCFEYGRGAQPLLESYCAAVYYYPRKSSSLSIRWPYIVASRRSNALEENLLKDNHPILLEGTHCTAVLHSKAFADRILLYRLHNIEHIYYRKLYEAEGNILKKLYYYLESRLLKSYEKKTAPKATAVLTVSRADADDFNKYCPAAHTVYLPLFLPWQKLHMKEGKGTYCLYHGNLAITENEQAALWLLQHVFNQPIGILFIIAGRQPSARLQGAVGRNKNCRLIPNPTDAEMQGLIQEAHVNIIVSFNATGIKLKLINALYWGRHCLVNKAAVEATGLETCCTIADTAKDIQTLLKELKDKPFTQQQIKEREAVLLHHFDNNKTASTLIQYLQP